MRSRLRQGVGSSRLRHFAAQGPPTCPKPKMHPAAAAWSGVGLWVGVGGLTDWGGPACAQKRFALLAGLYLNIKYYIAILLATPAPPGPRGHPARFWEPAAKPKTYAHAGRYSQCPVHGRPFAFRPGSARRSVGARGIHGRPSVTSICNLGAKAQSPPDKAAPTPRNQGTEVLLRNQKVCYRLSSPLAESFRLVNVRLDRIANRRSFALHRPAEIGNRDPDRRAPSLETT